MPQVHAFFDFDDTLLDGDSILYWLRYYYGKRPTRRVFQILNWAGLVLFVLRLIDSHTLKRIYLYPMSLEHPEVLDQLAVEFVQKDLARHLHAQVVKRLWTHHLLGHKIVIIHGRYSRQRIDLAKSRILCFASIPGWQFAR
jgi:phosphoserine phosphatase